MSRIEHLSSFFIERLMSVAAEIYEAVKDTVSDYEREIERTKEENHRLRELLAEISLSAAGELRDPATDLQPSRLEQSPEKLDSYQRPPDSDPSVLQQKPELTSVKEETESQQLPPSDVSASTSPCGKSVHGEEFTCLSGTLRMAEETDQQMDHVKLEQYDSQLACPSTVLNSIAEPAAGPSRDLMGSVMVTQGSNMVCEDPFIDSSSLASHLQYHENSSHDCKVCGQPFTKCACLFQHRKVVHDKGKLYCCKLCGKCYRQPHSLTVHFRNHTGEKPFRCKFCGKTFIDRGHCNEHERIHTGDKRYTCTVCGKSFVQSSQLRTHLRNTLTSHADGVLHEPPNTSQSLQDTDTEPTEPSLLQVKLELTTIREEPRPQQKPGSQSSLVSHESLDVEGSHLRLKGRFKVQMIWILFRELSQASIPVLLVPVTQCWNP